MSIVSLTHVAMWNRREIFNKSKFLITDYDSGMFILTIFVDTVNILNRKPRILLTSFKFIFCFFPKQPERSFSFTYNSVFNHNNMEMVIHSQLTNNETFICEILENVGPLGQI